MRFPTAKRIPLLVAAAAAAALPAIPRPAAAAASVSIDTPAWATSANLAGRASSARTIEVELWMNWNDAAAVVSLAHAVSTPGDPQYQHYLTTQQFIDRFAPTQAQVAAIQSWATSSGLGLAEVPQSRLYVGVTGTIGQFERLFNTSIDTYHVQGLTLFAPAGKPTLPSALSGQVREVTGLDQNDHLLHPDNISPADTAPERADASPVAAFRNAPPCSSYFAEKSNPQLPALTYDAAGHTFSNPNDIICGNTPETVRQLYGVSDAIAGGL